MKKILLTISLIIILSFECNSQLTKSKIYNHEITQNGDTIMTTRAPGDWWFGAYGEAAYSNYFGDFFFPEKIIYGVDKYDKFIKYKDGSYFPGITLGVLGEYSPSDKQLGYGLKIGIFDYIKNNLTHFVGDSLGKEYSVETTYKYFSISPYVKYNFSRFRSAFWDGLFVFSGFNFEIPNKVKTVYMRAFNNPERIEETFNYELKEQLGIGLDLFDANVEKGARTIFSPYLAFDVGSRIIKDFGSDQMAFNIKAGFALKLGVDKKRFDTLKYIPREKLQLDIPDVEPSVVTYNSLDLTQFDEMELIYINPVPEEEELKKIDEPKIEPSLEFESRPQKPTVAFDKKYIVNYPRSETDVELTKTGEGFFEELASFMKKNPGCIIIIEGYNDDRGGSIRENQRLSILRAENAKQELVNRGISSGRIVSSGKGAIKNIASNATPAGRAKNRRIEIIIKQNTPNNSK
jgi:outer membrane protein OmpA-like peptidoglycan-associated protein